MHVSKQCVFCRKVVHIIVDEAGYQRWQGGELIQNALPNLLPAEREMLISQCCETCFDGMFGEDAERDGLGEDLPPLPTKQCKCGTACIVGPLNEYEEYIDCDQCGARTVWDAK